MACDLGMTRLIQVFVVQLGMGVVYLIIALMVLKRDKKKLNQIFSAYYICMAGGIFVNVVYAALGESAMVLPLHLVTVFLFLIAPAFLLVFNLILLKSEKVIDSKKQALILGVFAVLLIIMTFIGLSGGVTIDATTDCVPVWDISFLVVSVIITALSIIPVIITSIQVYNKFEDSQLKKKWTFYFFGVFGVFMYMFVLPLANFMDDPTIRSLAVVLGLLLYVTAILLYYGVGKQIER